jgi:hypothetical protein
MALHLHGNIFGCTFSMGSGVWFPSSACHERSKVHTRGWPSSFLAEGALPLLHILDSARASQKPWNRASLVSFRVCTPLPHSTPGEHDVYTRPCPISGQTDLLTRSCFLVIYPPSHHHREDNHGRRGHRAVAFHQQAYQGTCGEIEREMLERGWGWLICCRRACPGV